MHPWGPERDDIRAQFIGATVLAPWQKGGSPPDLKAYFPHLFPPTPEMSPEEMIEVAKMLTLSHGGRIE
jgi:hypothetical protein